MILLTSKMMIICELRRSCRESNLDVTQIVEYKAGTTIDMNVQNWRCRCVRGSNKPDPMTVIDRSAKRVRNDALTEVGRRRVSAEAPMRKNLMWPSSEQQFPRWPRYLPIRRLICSAYAFGRLRKTICDLLSIRILCRRFGANVCTYSSLRENKDRTGRAV